MPFPNAHKAPTWSRYALIVNGRAADLIKRDVDRIAAGFRVGRSEPTKAASVVYLGLCHLRHLKEEDKEKEALDLCRGIFDRYNPSGGKGGLNCSHFSSEGTSEFVNHLPAIEKAGNLLLPRVKPVNKRCFVFMVVGTMYKQGDPLPPDDTWLDTFVW